MKNIIFETFHKIGFIPVLVIDSSEDAVPTARSLSAGGIPIAEVTLRTPAALEAIKNIADSCPDVLVGAGTVIDIDQAVQAYSAGAQFLVSPGLIPEVVIWAREHEVPMLCGAVTPTEIMQGVNLGMTIFKFFPSAAMGGIKTMKALSDPFPQIQFVPTGGIHLDNLAEHLQQDFILAAGGSWIARRETIRQHQFEIIAQEAAKTRDMIQQARNS